MRILALSEHFWPRVGGTVNYVHETCTALAARGHTVELLVPGPRPERVAEARLAALPYRVIWVDAGYPARGDPDRAARYRFCHRAAAMVRDRADLMDAGRARAGGPVPVGAGAEQVGTDGNGSDGINGAGPRRDGTHTRAHRHPAEGKSTGRAGPPANEPCCVDRLGPDRFTAEVGRTSRDIAHRTRVDGPRTGGANATDVRETDTAKTAAGSASPTPGGATGAGRVVGTGGTTSTNGTAGAEKTTGTRPDIVHVMFGLFLMEVLETASLRAAGVRTIATVHNVPPMECARSWPGAGLRQRLADRARLAVVAAKNSHRLRAHAYDAYVTPSEQVAGALRAVLERRVWPLTAWHTQGGGGGTGRSLLPSAAPDLAQDLTQGRDAGRAPAPGAPPAPVSVIAHGTNAALLERMTGLGRWDSGRRGSEAEHGAPVQGVLGGAATETGAQGVGIRRAGARGAEALWPGAQGIETLGNEALGNEAPGHQTQLAGILGAEALEVEAGIAVTRATRGWGGGERFIGPETEECMGAREPKAPDSATFRLLTVGGWAPHKRQIVIPDTLARLHAAGLPVVWEIAGPSGRVPGYRAAVLAAAARAGVAPHLIAHEALSQAALAACYDRADLYVQPSTEEGFCLTALDAAAAGLAVIGCPAGALPEICTLSGGALVPSAPGPLADAIARVLVARGAGRARPLGERAETTLVEGERIGSGPRRGAVGNAPEVQAAKGREAEIWVPDVQAADMRMASVRARFSWAQAATELERLMAVQAGPEPRPAFFRSAGEARNRHGPMSDAPGAAERVARLCPRALRRAGQD